MSDRAVLFVDGNNWYHSLSAIGLADLICETIEDSGRQGNLRVALVD